MDETCKRQCPEAFSFTSLQSLLVISTCTRSGSIPPSLPPFLPVTLSVQRCQPPLPRPPARQHTHIYKPRLRTVLHIHTYIHTYRIYIHTYIHTYIFLSHQYIFIPLRRERKRNRKILRMEGTSQIVYMYISIWRPKPERKRKGIRREGERGGKGRGGALAALCPSTVGHRLCSHPAAASLRAAAAAAAFSASTAAGSFRAISSSYCWKRLASLQRRACWRARVCTWRHAKGMSHREKRWKH